MKMQSTCRDIHIKPADLNWGGVESRADKPGAASGMSMPPDFVHFTDEAGTEPRAMSDPTSREA